MVLVIYCNGILPEQRTEWVVAAAYKRYQRYLKTNKNFRLLLLRLEPLNGTKNRITTLSS